MQAMPNVEKFHVFNYVDKLEHIRT